MLRRIVLCAVMLFVVSLPTACNVPARGAGPMTWIDQPLDGMHFPVQKLTLQAHASDEDGVASIQFYVGESPVQTVSAGGTRLGEAAIEWMPPGPGTYLIGASAVDGQGNSGSRAVAQISVGEVVITLTPTILIEQGVTITPTFTPTITFTPSPTVPPAPSAPSFTLDKNANCREGPGTAYEADETLMQGETVPIQGRNADNSWLLVTKPGASRNCWVSVVTGQIHGDINTVQYASAPPPPEPEAGESSGDTPPRISSVNLNPPSIHAQSCGGEPTKATISAVVTDDGGIKYVAARTSSGAEIAMSPVGGGTYQAVIGPFYDAGKISIVIVASDNTGNSAKSGQITLTIACGG